MKAANTIVVNGFGAAHVRSIIPLYPNPASETASGLASNWTQFNNDDQSNELCKSICDLPNETQVYGQQVWGRGSAYTNVGYEIGIDKFQFAIFALQRNFANTRALWWLRSVSSAAGAASVNSLGYAANHGSAMAHVSTTGAAYYGGSAYALGVRPRFLLIG